jgi:PIN domain nuclease of toxin-antitoxin system
MPGLLLDTNALIWFLSEAPMEGDALFAIAEAQAENTLFVSPITAWEAALAIRHHNPARRPDLQGQDAATWFREGRRKTGAKLVKIGVRIALEAARVPAIYGQGDPGDCYLIATARVQRLAIITRDGRMAALAAVQPAYLRVVPC